MFCAVGFPSVISYHSRMGALVKNFNIAELLPESERKVLTDRAAQKSYTRGSVLFHAEDRADFVWLLKEGRVHLTQYTSQGRALTNCVMAPGDVFCCLSSLDKKTYPSDAVAAVDSVVARIPIGVFSGWMRKYPAFAEKMLCFFCDRLRVSERRNCHSQEPVRDRILNVLATLTRKFGGTIPFTCREIAEMAGTTVETTIRVFTLLKKEKMVTAQRGKITISDPRKLQENQPV